jgi:hypothetical protein
VGTGHVILRSPHAATLVAGQEVTVVLGGLMPPGVRARPGDRVRGVVARVDEGYVTVDTHGLTGLSRITVPVTDLA